MSSNSISEIFTVRLANLQDSAQVNGMSMENYGTSYWAQLYSDKPGSDGKALNGFDSAEFRVAFDRTDLNKTYVDIASGKKPNASYRDAQVAKVQLDLLAAMERDLRMRYRSRVRQLAHGIARLQSHGLSVGPINRGIVNFVKLLADRQK